MRSDCMRRLHEEVLTIQREALQWDMLSFVGSLASCAEVYERAAGREQSAEPWFIIKRLTARRCFLLSILVLWALRRCLGWGIVWMLPLMALRTGRDREVM